MNRRLRGLIGLMTLAVCLAMLIWSYIPNPRETRIQQIQPVEMQLP